MIRLTWRSLRAHRMRLLLTSVAVILGTAFVAGTMVFTDTLQRTFDELIAASDADVYVEPDTPVTAWSNGAALITPAQADTIASTPGVKEVTRELLVDGVQVIGRDGTPVGVPQAPSFGAAWDDSELSGVTLASGRAPSGDDEVALDTQTAEKAGLAIGDEVHLVTPGPPVTATLVGLVTYGNGNLAGATMASFDPVVARTLLVDGRAGYTSMSVRSDGTGQDELAARLRAATVGEKLTISTGEQVRAEGQQTVGESLMFVNVFLFAFAGIALLVGSFLVLNTFSVLVAQRARDLALLRALGATRRQITLSVLGEALAVGIVGGTVGLALGVGIAWGIEGLFGIVGIEMPYAGLTVTWEAVAAAYGVAIIVTLVAAYLPARRASTVSPVAAMRDVSIAARRPLTLRTWGGAFALALGALLLVVGGWRDPSVMGLVAAGAAAVFVGAVMVSPALAGLVLGVVSRVARSHAATARLAMDNGRRNPRRTATTASALMIGLMMVGAFGVLGASSSASAEAAVDRTIRADLVVTGQSGRLFSPQVARTLAAVPGIDVVSGVTLAPVMIGGQQQALYGVDPTTIGQVVTIDTVAGNLADLRDRGVAVDETTARNQGWTVGSPVTVTLPGASATLRVAALYSTGLGISGVLVDRATLEAGGWPVQDVEVFATLEPGADATSVGRAVQQSLASYPNVTAMDRTQQKEAMRDQQNQLLALVYAMLALAILIAVLGIVNTLALSIVERTREIGLLRAVGATRRQIRGMIRWESVAIAVYGSVLGALLGVIIGMAISRGLRAEGISELAVPWTTLLVVLLLACLVGVAAAAVPARRAARLDVLAALATE